MKDGARRFAAAQKMSNDDINRLMAGRPKPFNAMMRMSATRRTIRFCATSPREQKRSDISSVWPGEILVPLTGRFGHSNDDRLSALITRQENRLNGKDISTFSPDAVVDDDH